MTTCARLYFGIRFCLFVLNWNRYFYRQGFAYVVDTLALDAFHSFLFIVRCFYASSFEYHKYLAASNGNRTIVCRLTAGCSAIELRSHFLIKVCDRITLWISSYQRYFSLISIHLHACDY